MAVKLIIDSASDIVQSEADEMGVVLLPMQIRFGDEEFLDGVNLSHEQFYEKLIESTELPKTSQINPVIFEEAFEEVAKNGDEVVVITISSKLSGTYASAKQASKNFEEKVFVVDSLNACVGERLLFEVALKLVKEGKNASEIAEKLNQIKGKINVIAMLDTLKYLRKGGRISSLVAFSGELFSIKPVVAVLNGEVKLVGKAVGSKKGNNLLNTLVEKKGIDFDMPYAVVYSGLDDTLLKKYIKDSEHLWKDKVANLPSYMIGSTIGTHIGPGAIGVAFFEK